MRCAACCLGLCLVFTCADVIHLVMLLIMDLGDCFVGCLEFFETIDLVILYEGMLDLVPLLCFCPYNVVKVFVIVCLKVL